MHTLTKLYNSIPVITEDQALKALKWVGVPMVVLWIITKSFAFQMGYSTAQIENNFSTSIAINFVYANMSVLDKLLFNIGALLG